MERHAGHEKAWSLETPRLTIRRAAPSRRDIALLLKLWTSPEAMTNVGFPEGLRTDAQKIEAQLRELGDGEYDCVLIVSLTASGELIGECKLGYPDDDGVANTDVKLLPQYWGNKYGQEIKRGLLDYLFSNTSCRRVTATPNVRNAASIKMQEAVGARKTREGVYKFPPKMADYTTDVSYLEYTVFREDWRG